MMATFVFKATGYLLQSTVKLTDGPHSLNQGRMTKHWSLLSFDSQLFPSVHEPEDGVRTCVTDVLAKV